MLGYTYAVVLLCIVSSAVVTLILATFVKKIRHLFEPFLYPSLHHVLSVESCADVSNQISPSKKRPGKIKMGREKMPKIGK